MASLRLVVLDLARRGQVRIAESPPCLVVAATPGDQEYFISSVTGKKTDTSTVVATGGGDTFVRHYGHTHVPEVGNVGFVGSPGTHAPLWWEAIRESVAAILYLREASTTAWEDVDHGRIICEEHRLPYLIAIDSSVLAPPAEPSTARAWASRILDHPITAPVRVVTPADAPRIVGDALQLGQ